MIPSLSFLSTSVRDPAKKEVRPGHEEETMHKKRNIIKKWIVIGDYTKVLELDWIFTQKKLHESTFQVFCCYEEYEELIKEIKIKLH